MRFRLLGPVEISLDDVLLPVGPARQRSVLALLLFRANRFVTVDELSDAVWERPPSSARSNVRTYVTGLRRVLRSAGYERLRSGPGGYCLDVLAGELDLDDFDSLTERAAEAARAGEFVAAAQLYAQAEALWYGDPLANQSAGPVLRAELARLNERREEAAERAIDCRLSLGQHQDLVGEIHERIAAFPYRESLRRQLILALYRSGRRAEALAAYQEIRELLVAELGVEPGRALRDLQAEILGDGGPRSRPTGTVAAPRLPWRTSGFVGREPELRRLDELSRSADLITISGPAGVGKTALALHWARSIAAAHPGGQIFLDLQGFHGSEPLSADAALSALLRSLGQPPDRMPPDPAARQLRYRELVADRRLLILLDDARSAEQIRPLLPEQPGCLVLVTSRERLAGLVASDGARPIVLDLLRPESAVALLADVLGDRRVADEAAAAARIARLCAGLPLAVRVVAARLATQPSQSIAAEAERLESGDRLACLRVTGDPATAVKTAFDHSYRALDESTQRLFRLAGCLPGTDFSAPVAAALLAVPLADAEAGLDRLCSANLVDHRPTGRYRFHDLLRQYAKDHCGAEERAAALERALSWYLHSTEVAGRTIDPHRRRSFALDPADPGLAVPRHPNREAALAWCETERVNLVAAVRLAAEHGLARLGWQLPVALFGFLELRRHWADWISTHEIGLACARESGLPEVESWMLNSLGIAFKQTGRYDEAFEHYREALRIRQLTGDRQAAAATLNNLGTASNQLGRFDAAADYYRQALVIFREVGDRWGEGLALTNLGEVHRREDRIDAALECYQQASEIRQAAGDLRGQGFILHNLGETCLTRGRTTEAIEHFRLSLEVRERVGDRWGTARTLAGLGSAHGSAGDGAAARDCLRRALLIFDELGDPQAGEVRELLARELACPAD